MKKEKIIKFIIYTIALVFGCLFGMLVSSTYHIRQVNGVSMENTLHDNQIIVVQSKFVKYKVGDIVVADIIKNNEKLTIIKRIIALEGQTVEIKDGILYVDSKKVKEDYIKEPMKEKNIEKITVPKGEVYLMGDNRNISYDSRIHGTVKLSKLKGKLIFKWR